MRRKRDRTSLLVRRIVEVRQQRGRRQRYRIFMILGRRQRRFLLFHYNRTVIRQLQPLFQLVLEYDRNTFVTIRSSTFVAYQQLRVALSPT